MSEFIAGVGLVAHLSTFLWCAFGAALGIVLGALPGLTATMGIALVIPISYQLDTATGIGLLLAVYCGAVCGASIPAILLGIPGNPNAIATTEDGQLMTKKGMAGQALGAAVIASMTGGLGGILGTFLGIFLLKIVDSALVMMNVSVYWQDFVQGAILVIAVTIDYMSHRKSGNSFLQRMLGLGRRKPALRP